MDSTHLHYSGTQISYYFVCHRKLWLFSHGIKMEHTSDIVYQGKIIGEESYNRRISEINLFDTIVLDGFDPVNGIIHEVKKSRRMDKAHIWQVKYYLYYLKSLGIEAKGEIDYPLLKRKEHVDLTEQDIHRIDDILSNIKIILNEPSPPKSGKLNICKKCSYYEFCFI